MINFRKIASVLASTVMVGSTVAMAAAANFPDPFVKSGVDSVGIVYGANAQVDLTAVLDVQSKLATELAGQTATGTTSAAASTISGGDFIKLERGTNMFNLGEAPNSFYSNIDEDQLSTVLKAGIYSNDDNNDYDFEQKITMSTLSYFENSKFNKDDPKIGFNVPRNAHILNYTLDFTPDAADNVAALGASTGNKLETSDLPMLGRTYYIQKVERTANGVKMSLLDNANSAIVTEGETKTITVGETSYDISIVFISSAEVKLNVNGVTTNSLAEGGVYKVASDTYVAVKDLMARDKTGTVDKVEVSIGSGKIVLENDQEVEVNTEKISNMENADGSDKYPTTLKAHFTNTSIAISQIKLEWNTDEEAWVVPGTDLLLPGFETIKISMGGFNMPLKEVTKIEDSDSVVINTVIKDGALKLPILCANASFSAFDCLGEDNDHLLRTTRPNNTSPTFALSEYTDDYFVASWVGTDEAESFAYELKSITSSSGKNTTTLDNLAVGGADVEFSEVLKTKDVGHITFTLVSAQDSSGNVTICATPASSGTVYGDRLFTKEGLMITLPWSDSRDAQDGWINLTVNATGNVLPWPTTHVINFTEEDVDGNMVDGGANQRGAFRITAGVDYSNSGTEPTFTTVTGGITLKDSVDNDVKTGYVPSALATKLTYTSPSSGLNDIEIEYHGGESFADVFVSESGAAVTATTGTTSTGVKTLGSVSVKDTEVTSVSSKNLIVVGGSCVNTVAAKLLGSDSAVCGDAFKTKTGVDSGQYLIETFASPYTTGKVATLVAGYNAGDTSNAAKFLTTQTVDTTAGKKYVGTTSTTATLSTTSTGATTNSSA